MNREELAWAAGFFDGEGTTYVSRSHGDSYLSVIVSQNDRDILERFQHTVNNLGYVYGPYGPYKNSKSQPTYRWQTKKFEHVQATIAMLWEFLSSAKKQQYINAVEIIKKGDDSLS